MSPIRSLIDLCKVQMQTQRLMLATTTGASNSNHNITKGPLHILNLAFREKTLFRAIKISFLIESCGFASFFVCYEYCNRIFKPNSQLGKCYYKIKNHSFFFVLFCICTPFIFFSRDLFFLYCLCVETTTDVFFFNDC